MSIRLPASPASADSELDRALSLARTPQVPADLAARIVRRTDAADTIHLTPTEWRMLEALLRRPGMLTTPGELLMAMRGDPGHVERSYLRSYLQQLRRKLEADPSRPRYLLTEPGLGYRYQP